MKRKRSKISRRQKVEGLESFVTAKDLSRRLACWKSVTSSDYTHGVIKEQVYVDLQGFIHFKKETKLLSALGVTRKGPNSSLDDPPIKESLLTNRNESEPCLFWGTRLPLSVSRAYEEVDGLRGLYEWQGNILRETIKTKLNENIICIAPTSGGKSLIGDVLLLRELLLYGRKGLAIYPQIAICEEKLAGFASKFSNKCHPRLGNSRRPALALRLDGIYGSEGLNWTGRTEIGFCTAEKANQVIIRLLLDHPLAPDTFNKHASSEETLFTAVKDSFHRVYGYFNHPIDTLGTIVIDEIHEAGQKGGRGAIIEMLIAKLNIIRELRQMSEEKLPTRMNRHPPPRLVCLSGTLSNYEEVSKWVKGRVYKVDHRPQSLTFYVVLDRQVYKFDSKSSLFIKDRILPPSHWEFELQKDLNGGISKLGIAKEKSSTTDNRTVLPQCRGFVDDPSHLGWIVYEVWRERLKINENNVPRPKNILIFCPSKIWTENVASFLTKQLPLILLHETSLRRRLKNDLFSAPDAEAEEAGKAEEEEAELEDIDSLVSDDHKIAIRRRLLRRNLIECVYPETLNPVQEKAVSVGVAFHHAGLSTGERKLIEAGFQRGVLRVLCATSTLAMGVNMPVSRVIFRTVRSFSPVQFHQMAGRAGRTTDDGGEVYIIQDPSKGYRLSATVELIEARKQLNVNSTLEGTSLARFILELFVLRPEWPYQSLFKALRDYSLAGIQRPPALLQAQFDSAVALLAESHLVMMTYTAEQSDRPSKRRLNLAKDKIYQSHKSWLSSTPSSMFNLLSFFGLSARPKSQTTVQFEAIFHDLYVLYEQLFGQTPNQVSINQVSINRASRSTVTAANQPVLELPIVLESQPDNIHLTPSGRAVIESGLKLSEALESLALILRVTWLGLHLKSLLHLLYICVPVSVFCNQATPSAYCPNWVHIAHVMSSVDKTVLEVNDIDIEFMTRLTPEILKTIPNSDSVYDSVAETGFQPDTMRYFRLVWSHLKFAGALILFELICLQNSPHKILTLYSLSNTELTQLRRQTGIRAGCLAVMTAVLELPQLSTLLRHVGQKLTLSSSQIVFGNQSPPDTSIQQLQQLSLLKEERAKVFAAAGITSIANLANASQERITAILRRNNPFNFSKMSSVDKSIQDTLEHERSWIMAKAILSEARQFLTEHPSFTSNMDSPVVLIQPDHENFNIKQDHESLHLSSASSSLSPSSDQSDFDYDDDANWHFD